MQSKLNKYNKEISFPVITFSKDDKLMLSLNTGKLIGDIRLIDQCFKNVNIIDSKGIEFKVVGVEKASGIKIWPSVKYIGLMVELRPIIVETPMVVTLESLKERIISHVKKNKKSWHGKPFSEIKQEVENSTSFSDTISLFV